MRKLSGFVGILTALMFVAATVAVAEERDPLKARVPADQIADAKKLTNPIAKTPENIAKGKALFEGKGDGPAGQILNPSPRNFTNCKFHKKRKDGELFWVIKNGSPGTGMVPLIPAAITEEEAWTVINYERSFCKKDAE